jgi:hypothetical protein
MLLGVIIMSTDKPTANAPINMFCRYTGNEYCTRVKFCSILCLLPYNVVLHPIIISIILTKVFNSPFTSFTITGDHPVMWMEAAIFLAAYLTVSFTASKKQKAVRSIHHGI